MARFSGNGISLDKGDTVAVASVQGEAVKYFHVGLGWDIHEDEDADLDAYILELDEENRLIEKIYFGNLKSKDGAIVHQGDNLTGAGEGDDEVINIDLDKLNPRAKRLVVAVTIYRANMTFDKVDNAFVRLVNAYDETEFIRYDLTNETGKNFTMHVGDIIKKEDNNWDFTAVGQASKHTSISEFCDSVTTGKAEASTSSTINNSNSSSGNNGGGLFGRIGRLFK